MKASWKQGAFFISRIGVIGSHASFRNWCVKRGGSTPSSGTGV